MNDAPRNQTDSHKLPRNVKLLGLASLLNDVASEMIVPLMPTFLLSVLGSDKSFLGIIEGVADSVSSLLKLWAGAWSDRAGKRKSFVVFGYTLAAIARPLIGVAAVPWQAFAARTADRIGKGIRTSPRDAMIADSAAPAIRGRAFGFHRAMDHLGAAIGPLLAILFLLAWPEQYRPLFLLTLIPGLLAAILLVFGLREQRVVTVTSEPMKLTLAPFDANFRLYLLALVIFTLGNSSDLFLLARAEELGVPAVLLPLLWCLFHIVKSSANLLAGRAVDKVGARPMIYVGWGMYAVVYLAFALATQAWQIWTLFLVYGLFFALAEPAEKTLVTALVGPERKGLAFGWFNFAIGVSALPSNVIFGLLYQHFGALAAFGWGSAMAVAAALLMLAVRPKQVSRNPSPVSDNGP